MINKDDTLRAFKEKFSKMTYEEQEAYLKKMGLTFEKKRKTQQTPCQLMPEQNFFTVTVTPKQSVLRQVPSRIGIRQRKPHRKKVVTP